MKDIRIGTMTGRTGHRAPEYINQIKDHGFECFQIKFWQTLGGANLPQMAEELKPILEESDTVISALAVFGNPLETGEKDLETLEAWKRCIEHAHLFGTDLVTGFTGRVRGGTIPDSIPRFKEVFGELATLAADKGVRLAFENCAMGGTWRTGDWNIAHSPKAWELMFDAVDADNVGLEWEPAHQLHFLIDPLPQLREWIDKVFHVHGKDAMVLRDVVAKYGVISSEKFAYDRMPGLGDTNWADIFDVLRLNGYEGTIDIEGWHDPVYREELEMTGQVNALNYLKKCRGNDFVKNPDFF